jgi:hypothetical protein
MFIVYMVRSPRTFSGGVPGFSRAAIGTSVDFASDELGLSEEAATDPGATRNGEREFVFAELLRPEIPGEFFGLPPLTLIPGTTDPFPFAPPALPPGLLEFPPVPPFVGAPFVEPPGEPGWLPSGEMEIFAETFPAGIGAAGMGGPGEAESAMMC